MQVLGGKKDKSLSPPKIGGMSIPGAVNKVPLDQTKQELIQMHLEFNEEKR